MKLEFFLQNFEKFSNVKFNEIGLVGALLFHAERGVDRQIYIHIQRQT
jgi:hypothetical protein